VDASTFVTGAGGSIDVAARRSIVVEGPGSGIASRTGGEGRGGNVELSAPRIEIREGGVVSARSAAGLDELGEIFANFADLIGTPGEARGRAGAVTIAGNEVHLVGGTIATDSAASDGGDVTIRAREIVHLDDGRITAAVTDGAGGNITIQGPVFVVLQDGSQIVADAGAGTGGNIQITTENLFAFPGSVIDASSDFGVDGIVAIHAPDTNLAGELAPLPESFLDAVGLMKQRCAARGSGEGAGSFVRTGRYGAPGSPDGPVPAFYDDAKSVAGMESGLVGALVVEPTDREPIALLVSCS
jgi:large exoprotein involved in heme utilization and adhesion